MSNQIVSGRGIKQVVVVTSVLVTLAVAINDIGDDIGDASFA